MANDTRLKLLHATYVAAGLCGIVAVIASMRGVWGVIQVWIGHVTAIPLIGEVSYHSNTPIEPMFALFQVGFSGLAYGFMWVIPAVVPLGLLTIIANYLKRPRSGSEKPKSA